MAEHASGRNASAGGQFQLWHSFLRPAFLVLVALSSVLMGLFAFWGHRTEDVSQNLHFSVTEPLTVARLKRLDALKAQAPVSSTQRFPLLSTFSSGVPTSDLANTKENLPPTAASQTVASTFGLSLLPDALRSRESRETSRNSSEFESVFGTLQSEESPAEFALLMDALQMGEKNHQLREAWLQDLGMYDSGTNLLYDTVAMNFPLCTANQEKRYLIRHLLSVEDFCVRFMSIDKHSNPTRFLAAAKGTTDGDFNSRRSEFTKREHIVIVAMVRDPLAQLQAWKKSPYEMKSCFLGNGTDWLEQKCKFQGFKNEKGKGRAGGFFSSIPELWNAYGWGYRQLQLEGGYKEVLITKYEDVVMHPHNFIRRLALALNVTLPAALATAHHKAKMHGRASNRTQAKKNIRNREFVRSFSEAELEAACKHLDSALVQLLGYEMPECEKP